MTLDRPPVRIPWLDWLRVGPFLAQLVVTRRCNLSCDYCSEFDTTSRAVPFEMLQRRMAKLAELRTWALALMGGEPTLHPDLLRIFQEMRRLGFQRRMMTTNGLLLTRRMVDGLNESGLTDLNVSVDGVKRSPSTLKVLEVLRPRLEALAERARFDVVLNVVIGVAPREEVLEVVDFALLHRFAPRLLLIHDESGQIRLSQAQMALYLEVKRKLGSAAEEAGNYRDRLIQHGEAPFRCRSGARYLYVDEFGLVRWCAQTRWSYGKELLEYTVDDLREQFYLEKPCHVRCSVACARTVSAFDRWRGQRSQDDARRSAPQEGSVQ
jgi:MoaA/NifB/PqqE/SkfB family radical SAM enzyme